jgi:hypothetical protein
MLRKVDDDIVRDVLPGTAGHVVDDCGALVEAGLEVCVEASLGGLAVVGVDLQGSMHAHL